MGAGASPSSIPSSVPLVETDAQPETPGAQTQSPRSRAPPFPSCRLILPADSPQGDLTVNPLRIRARPSQVVFSVRTHRGFTQVSVAGITHLP